MAIIGDIGDAVVTLIEGSMPYENFTYTISREWVSTEYRHDIKEADPITVAVVPSTLGAMAFDLAPRVALDWALGIWIVKAVEPTPEFIDPIAEFMEKIVDLLARNRLLQAGDHKAKCIGIEAMPAYDPEELLNLRLFRSVIVATYRVTR